MSGTLSAVVTLALPKIVNVINAGRTTPKPLHNMCFSRHAPLACVHVAADEVWGVSLLLP